MTTSTVNPKEAGKSAATVSAVMRQCGLRVLLVPALVAAIVGLVLAAPTIFNAILFVWYGWAGIITEHYTSVVPATLIEWTSIILFIWAVCVCCKLSSSDEDWAVLFGLLAAVIFLFGIEVSNCALFAMVSDWSPSDVTGWKLAGVLTNGLNLGISGLAGVIAFFTMIVMGA